MIVFNFVSFLVTMAWLILNKLRSETYDHFITVILLGLAYICSFSSMLCTMYKVMSSDPSDPTIALERRARLETCALTRKHIFDPDQYSFYCDLCNTHVFQNSKHCFKCNRCTFEFDHHCSWLGNDIGLYNYVDFLRMLLAILLACFAQIALSMYTLAKLQEAHEDHKNNEFSISLNVLTWLNLVLTLSTFILDVNLLIFHLYLICTGQSTYRYIKRRREARNKKLAEGGVNSYASTAAASI